MPPKKNTSPKTTATPTSALAKPAPARANVNVTPEQMAALQGVEPSGDVLRSTVQGVVDSLEVARVAANNAVSDGLRADAMSRVLDSAARRLALALHISGEAAE